MKKIKRMVLLILTLVMFGLFALGSGESHDSSNDEYGYYEKSDGTRIWYEK